MPERPLAVFDIGSNSGRAIVVRLIGGQHIEILSDARATLRLVTDVDRDGRLGSAALERTVIALHDFLAIAAGAGAKRTIAVATAAVREATNSREFVNAVERETGVELRVLAGDEEAAYAFWGAVHGLPIEDGMLIDVGGGSTEITRFARRRSLEGWTLPLGALRMTGKFLSADPPRPAEMQRLVNFTRETLESAGVPALNGHGVLVGTGGTIRNLAKAHRAPRNYPIPRLHGYTMTRRDVADVTARLSSRTANRLAAMRGLTVDRADSIVGGALVTDTIMDVIGAGRILTSGMGLREGIALEAFHENMPASRSVRRIAIDALTARFATWTPTRARRRALLAYSIVDGLGVDIPENGREMLGHAAWLLDIGRSVDFYERFEHTAEIVAASDIQGFTHSDIAMLAAIIREAGEDLPSLRAYGSLLDSADRKFVERAGLVLALADEIERRLPPGAAPQATVTTRRQSVTVCAALVSDWRPAQLGQRFRKVMRRALLVTSDTR